MAKTEKKSSTKKSTGGARGRGVTHRMSAADTSNLWDELWRRLREALGGDPAGLCECFEQHEERLAKQDELLQALTESLGQVEQRLDEQAGRLASIDAKLADGTETQEETGPEGGNGGQESPLDLSRYWDSVIRRRSRDSDLKTYEIRSRLRKLDPLARAALKAVADEPEVKKNVRQKVQDEGIASEILQVTRLLNQRHMSDARREVLAATYASSLESLFESAKNGNLDKQVQDTTGFANAVIIDQEKEKGALEEFSKELVGLVAQKNRLELEQGMQDRLIKQVRSNI